MAIAPGTRFRHAGRGVPEDTSLDRLRALLDRYQSASDPAVEAMPMQYRAAVIKRLRHLLASRAPEGVAA